MAVGYPSKPGRWGDGGRGEHFLLYIFILFPLPLDGSRLLNSVLSENTYNSGRD